MADNLKKIIWISPFLPYETVNHAGGKNQYYYLKNTIDSGKFDIRIVGFYKPDELKKFTFSKRVKCSLFCYYDNGLKKFYRNFMDLNYLKNPFHRYANITTKFLEHNILKTMKKYKREGHFPDIIILQWTQTLLFVKKIKKIFPDTKIIGIEEDVSLLSYKRRIDLAQNRLQKKIAYGRFRNIEISEINALKLCDLIIVNNHKDLKLLKQYGLDDSVRLCSAFFENMFSIKRAESISNTVLFYGAMSRPENYLSAKWLLENVKPLLDEENVKFVILGGDPNPCLEQYKCKNVIITGFVDDVNPYFAKSLCLAAPLVLGAGIKVKILEALSSGLPVLTNNIGIEGIPAIDRKDYFFCESPEEYATIIKKLLSSSYDFSNISNSAKNMVKENFNYSKNSQEFINWLEQL